MEVQEVTMEVQEESLMAVGSDPPLEGPHRRSPKQKRSQETSRKSKIEKAWAKNTSQIYNIKTPILFRANNKSWSFRQGLVRAMFFFFVGGLQQEVQQVLKSGVGKCMYCRNSVDLVNSDKVLKLFFVPVWRWPAKDPLLHCSSCKNFFPYNYSLPPAAESPPAVAEALRCRFCEREVEADFRFCPFCGSELWMFISCYYVCCYVEYYDDFFFSSEVG